MKIHILFNFREGPWGGGNQFLKGLTHAFHNIGVLTDSIDLADLILVNGNPQSCERYSPLLYRLAYQKPTLAFVLRLDGPVSLIRGGDVFFDNLLKVLTGDLMDGVIYQSHWSKVQNERLFGFHSQRATIIHNAADEAIFWRKPPAPGHHPIRLIATSWSPNMRKGFELYRYLDENLDFSRYRMSFVGNTPFLFRNIRHIPAVDSAKLAAILREHDIYITASQKDPCSNSLIEALACGLPAVALRDGGHPELIRQGGDLFDGPENVLPAIDRVAANLTSHQDNLPVHSLAAVAKAYHDFCQLIVQKRMERQASYMKLFLKSRIWRIRLDLYSFYSRLRYKIARA